MKIIDNGEKKENCYGLGSDKLLLQHKPEAKDILQDADQCVGDCCKNSIILQKL